MMPCKMAPELYTTEQAAARAGISRATLQAWIAAGKFEAPPKQIGNVRLWKPSDVARLQRVKARIYGKGVGRPKKRKA